MQRRATVGEREGRRIEEERGEERIDEEERRAERRGGEIERGVDKGKGGRQVGEQRKRG